MKLSLNILPATSFILFGLVMIYGSISMEDSFSGSNQHRWVPLAMSIFVVVLATGLLARQVRSEEIGQDSSHLEPRSFFFLVLPVMCLLAAYAQAQIWFGYAAATFASGVLIFRLFGNSWIVSILHGAVATVALYILFFKLLKLYNPPGRLLDLPLPF